MIFKMRKPEDNPEKTARVDRSELDKSRDRVYKIIDNGYCPFLVKIRRNIIRIYTWGHRCDDHCIYYHPKLVLAISKFTGYWSGYDSERIDEPIHGNSLLIEIKPHRYIYIGSSIYSFVTADRITDYVSPVGNNDVPYPSAFGTKYVYWMDDDVKAKRSEVLPYEPTNASMNIARLLHCPEPTDPKVNFMKMRHIKVIHKRYYE